MTDDAPETDLDRAERDAHQFLQDAKRLCELPDDLWEIVSNALMRASHLISFHNGHYHARKAYDSTRAEKDGD